MIGASDGLVSRNVGGFGMFFGSEPCGGVDRLEHHGGFGLDVGAEIELQA